VELADEDQFLHRDLVGKLFHEFTVESLGERLAVFPCSPDQRPEGMPFVLRQQEAPRVQTETGYANLRAHMGHRMSVSEVMTACPRESLTPSVGVASGRMMRRACSPIAVAPSQYSA